MKQLLKNFWNYLNGKKTIIGGIVMLVARGGQAFFPDLMDPAQYEFIETLGAGISTVGLGHKAIKTKTVNNAICIAQNVMNSRKANK